MKVKIAYLYYDLMNLYGENGNIKALVKHFENRGINPIVHFLTVNDNIDFEKYDIYYLGSVSALNFQIVLKDIKKYQKNIKKAIENNKMFIATGNSYELFGKEIKYLDNTKDKLLNIFDYNVETIDFRIVGETYAKFNNLNKYIIGFQNRNTIIKNVNNSLFNITFGVGYEPNSNKEGYLYKNFFGTYLIGPLLVRNPYFTEYLIQRFLDKKNDKYKPKKKLIDYKAYNEYIKNFIPE